MAATLIALVPFAGLLLDAVSGSDNPPGAPTPVGCDSAWCFPSLRHVVLEGTLGPAAVCAGAAIAVATAVLVRGRARRWPPAVIVLAVVSMIPYAAFV